MEDTEQIGYVTKTWNTFVQKIHKTEYLIIYAIVITILLVFLLSYLPGIFSNWYNDLKFPAINPWIARIVWVLALAISYVGLFLLWGYSEGTNGDLIITLFYSMGTLLWIAWSVALFHGNNLPLALWISTVLFIYEFWFIIYIWNIRRIAALFLIPLLLMYFYLVYYMAKLISLNNISV